MMQRPVALTLAILSFTLMATASANDKKGDGIPDVKGTVYRVDGNKNTNSAITANVGDTIVIEYTYPISPPFPKSAKQMTSDGDIAKTTGVHRVVQVKGPIGAGRFAAVFVAQKAGKATLEFNIERGDDTAKISCSLEVK